MRVKAGDLRFAAEWLRAYEEQPDDPDALEETAHRVAEWLDAQAESRDVDAIQKRIRASTRRKPRGSTGSSNVLHGVLMRSTPSR